MFEEWRLTLGAKQPCYTGAYDRDRSLLLHFLGGLGKQEGGGVVVSGVDR